MNELLWLLCECTNEKRLSHGTLLTTIRINRGQDKCTGLGSDRMTWSKLRSGGQSNIDDYKQRHQRSESSDSREKGLTEASRIITNFYSHTSTQLTGYSQALSSCGSKSGRRKDACVRPAKA